MSNPPFLSHKKLFVICPTDFAGIEPAIAEKLRNIPLLIDENITSLQNELGCEIIINGHPNSFAAKWYIGPRMCNPQLQMIKKDESAEPELILDKEKGILICDATNPLAIFETFSYLRSLTYLNEPKLKINYCQSNNEIAERIYQELKISFPFQAKEKNCELLYHKYRNQLIQDANPIPIAQQWLAELNDAHTCVRPTPP